jgi:UDP-GlcNAc:undecaprenyl-phosphate GlcNAc-1-phosphate transferase
LIALGLPIMDTLFAMARRLLERRPIFSADRGHIHHQLLAMGINHRRAVLILYGLSIMFTTGAILLSMGRDWQVGGALFVLSIAVIGVVRSMGDLHVTLRRWRRRERVRSAAVERLRETVPAALPRIVAAGELADLPRVLEEFARTAQLSGVELAGSQIEQLASFDWAAPAVPGESEAARSSATREAITAAFAIPAAGADATLRLSFITDEGELAPDADILLQLVADALDARLRRSESGRFSVTEGRLRSV